MIYTYSYSCFVVSRIVIFPEILSNTRSSVIIIILLLLPPPSPIPPHHLPSPLQPTSCARLISFSSLDTRLRCLSPSPPRSISRTPHVEITRLIRPAGSRGHNVKEVDRPKLSSPSSHSLQQVEGAVVIAQLYVLVLSLGLYRTDGLLPSASLLFLVKSTSYSSGSQLLNIRLLGNSERDGRLLSDHLAITPVSPSVPKAQALHLTNPSHG